MNRHLVSASAAIAAFFVLVIGGSAADTFTLTVVSQTNSTITFSYPQQPGYGYLYSANGVVVSRTNDPTRTQVKFSKTSSYEVAAIVKGNTGSYPVAQPPPPPAACANGLDDDGDGKIDLADPGCSSASDTDETDPAPPPPAAACSDTIDNDGDGKIDLADPGCSSSTDTDETDPVQPPPTGACDATTPNVPGGPDGNGGCFPGLNNTGPNAPVSAMAAYTGPCNITVANTVIDSKVIRCDQVTVNASGLVIKNSYVFAYVHGDGPSFTIQDSIVDGARSNGYACINCGVDNDNFTILRSEIIHTNRGAYCSSNCLIQDSYVHGTNLEPVASNLAHASAVRVEQGATLRHNTLWCDYMGPFPNSEIGCSADITGYPDFAPIHNNTVDGNLLMQNNVGASFCAYGGNTAGKPYSSDPTNGTNVKYTNNVFDRGPNGKCGFYGPITDFSTTKTGNVWSGNVWSDGGTVPPG